MASRHTILCITTAFIAVAFTEAQAGPEPECPLAIEINALRGGSPTVTVGGTKDITAKARIAKGTATSGTTIETTLQLDVVDGLEVIQSRTSFPIVLEVGKGGSGNKLSMEISQCKSGSIDFVARFFGYANNGALCDATRRITKTCK